MFIETITLEEIAKKFVKDVQEIIIKKEDSLTQKFYPRVSKSTNTKPIPYQPITFDSSSGITYVMTMVNLGKNYPKHSRLGCITYGVFKRDGSFSKRGTYAIVLTKTVDGDFIVIYTPHFFERYRERHLKNKTLSIGATITGFFASNTTQMISDIPDPKHENNYYSVCRDGLCLCSRIANNIFVADTFIAPYMFYDSQYSIVDEARSAFDYIQKSGNTLFQIPPAFYVDIATHEVYQGES